MADQKPTVKKTMVVEYVQPEPNKWTKDDGSLTLFFVTANFADGTEGSIGVTESYRDSTMDALRAIKDQPTEFTLAEKGEFNGRMQWTIKDFPGKPSGAGGGGGRGQGGGGGMTHAQVGLLAAATALAPSFATGDAFLDGPLPDLPMIAGYIEDLGNTLTERLRAQSAAFKPTEEKSGGNGQAEVPAMSSITLPQMQRLKELGAAQGLDTIEKIASKLGVGVIGELTADQARTAIEAWGG